ncbi:HlyD family secretion protein [Burkholderia cepacia]|uniref:Secretion protein HlyD family protein n=1 Tax=Burkholderia cepacia GG4 TaxID=1009846 RepID=A0A9W3K4D5_BURCE|nr:HlyD family efflux transporter periplasmic adaptor subunit [Burkholderia cepacia]AFQ50742.1 secretion protein HlyD family protein [Burkholderia cepacia GG4]
MSATRALPLALALAASVAVALLAGCGRPAHEGATYQGYVEGEFVYLSSSQAGTLTQLSVERGQAVAAGTPVFALEAVSETAALEQAQHQLAAARAQLADLQTGKRPPEVAVTQAQLAQATAQAARAAAQLARDERQYAAGGLSKQQLDDSRTSGQTTAAQMRELQHQVEVARLPGRGQQVAAQAAQVDAAQAALAAAEWKLDQKRVAAPAAGRVYDTLYRVGEWVQAGNPVVQMLPTQNLKVRFFVPEAAIASLAPGRAIAIHCDGCAADVPARITYVSREAEYTPPVIYSNESRTKLVFMVEARPALADAPKLHPGQPVAVRLR